MIPGRKSDVSPFICFIMLITAIGVPRIAYAQEIVEAFPDLTFTRPVDLQHAGDGTDRLFVVEQRGIIRVFENDAAAATSDVFLDISSIVNDAGNEQGLLGLAFHPDYASNGYFFVDYTSSSPNRSVIARYRVRDDDPHRAEPSSATVFLEVAQPYSNHNGGRIVFGPDGYLYVSFGDGGSGGDPQGNGQNRATLLGSIIRIDVDSPGDTAPYRIPPDNPFAGNTRGFREEIYAYGLRNTWRFSFDPPTGKLWAGDVGQNRIEEIDIIQPGGNYGWNIMEGAECYESLNCDTAGLILPVVEYDHSVGNSVTGGFVYRGHDAAADLAGDYVYADYGSGRVWALTYDGIDEPANRLIADTGFYISSFGIDESGELYMLDLIGGKIHRFESLATTTGETAGPDGDSGRVIIQNTPNPFNAGTTIVLSQPVSQDIRLVIYNSAGQAVRHLADGRFEAGVHRLYWNGADDSGTAVGAGLYVYRAEHGRSTTAGTMMLMK